MFSRNPKVSNSGIDGPSSAAQTPGSSWAMMRPAAAALARETRRGRAGGPLRQPDRPARDRDRGTSTALVRAQHRPSGQRRPAPACGTRSSAGWGRRWTGSSTAPGRCSRPSSCCPGRSRRRRRPRSTWRSCSTTCGSPTAKTAVLSIITGGGKWVEITIPADPLYQHLLLTAEKKFWRCVETGEPPRLFGVEPPRPRIEAVRIVDMSSSNSWAEFAGTVPQHARRLSRT